MPFWGLKRQSSRSESFACEWRSRGESMISVLFSRRGAALLLALIVFVTAAAFRRHGLDAHWSSDEARWLNRSAQFMSAVKKGEFSDTLIAYHPGVTTMWLAGLRTFFIEPRVDVENLAAARWFIGFIVWAGIGTACLLLYRLFGKWIALAGVACLAYSPLFLAQTRRVHTDALATTFILLTALLFLLYCQNQHRYRYLIFSSIAFGLAILSKSYALILLPWLPVCLCLFQDKEKRRFWKQAAAGLCFLKCTALIFFALWPVFWTPLFGFMTLCLFGLTLVLFRGMREKGCPIWLLLTSCTGLILLCGIAIRIVWPVFDRVNRAVTTPHEVEHFFLGKVVYDPGWLFYPLVLLIKSTPLMLPLALVGCILLWRQRKHTEQTARHFKTALALVIGIVLFTVCLSATSKKFSRYLLPVFPLLEILAAIGLVAGLKWSYRGLVSRFGAEATAKYKTALAVLVCIGFFFIQTLPVLALHPYYGTYYNLCWKVTDITKIITVGEASGLDIAANYLNEKPNANRLSVQVSPLATEIVRYYFMGFVYRADSVVATPADYEVVYIRESQIGRVSETGTLNGDLEAVITLNGIDHVWIYRIPNKKTP